MKRAPGSSVVGFVPYANELVLSGHFQKKVITVNYDFSGYRYACLSDEDPADMPLHKNQIFYRETTSPGLYAPLLQILMVTYASGDPSIEVSNNDKNKLGSGSAALLHFFDNSASAWASGANDRNRYVSSIGADDSGDSGAGYAELTISGTFTTTPQAATDVFCAAVDAGVVAFIDYVIVDQEIDFRSTAKPDAIAANFAIDALYVARINQRMLNGYSQFPSNFIATWKAACQRFIIDNPQI